MNMKQTPISLSIIVVSYNTKDLTLATLDSVVSDLDTSDLLASTELIIVDNKSTDDSVQAIKKWIGATQKKHQDLGCKLIENSKNSGFAHANNLGIDHAKGNFFFLLNSDTIVQPGSISQLLTRFSEHPINDETAYVTSYAGKIDKLGMLAASLLNTDGSYQAQGGDTPTLFTLAAHLLFVDDLPLIGSFIPSTQHTGKRTFEPRFALEQKGWVAATAVMVRKELIQDIGNMDTNIFMYGEDVEWSMRAKNHHWDIAIDHDAKVMHYGSASSHSSRAIKGEFLGYKYIWAKHKPLWQRPLLKGLLQLACVLRVLLFGTILKQQERALPYRELLGEL